MKSFTKVKEEDLENGYNNDISMSFNVSASLQFAMFMSVL